MRILITAPSLDERQNVSGISTIVRQIIEHSGREYSHFVAGRRDRESANAAWLAKQAMLPIRFFARVLSERPDVVHINTALTDLSIWRDAALVRAARAAGRPVLLSVHGGKYLMGEFANARLQRVAENMLRRACSVVVYSELEANELRRRWPGLNIEILPNAIPFDDVPTAARNNAVPKFIFFGRMHESKGLHELIDAVRILRSEGCDFELDAYGDGPIKEFAVKGLSDALGDRFNYGGVAAGDNKWEKLANADIFVLPSRYGEGLPMAMLEAMAVGCIVVTADVASVVSVVANGENGFVVRPYDAEWLAATLRSILDDREAWPRIRQNAVATIRENFAIGDHIRKLERIYRGCTQKK